MTSKRLVVLTGAGISAESGIATFRDSGGLWEGHRVEDVATPEGWHRNPALVLEFYNQRRKNGLAAEPNQGHRILAALQADFDVTIITQNVDNLHERAGSKNVIHLHGSLFESRSTADPNLIYPISGADLNLGDLCEKGSQLRPNIVWFGEAVPMMDVAARIAAQSEIFVVVGTSLVVYPAAGLVDYVPDKVPKFVIDPKVPDVLHLVNLTVIQKGGSEGLKEFQKILKNRL